eukprot:TRINITY_DN21062_c0_g1_i1.p1 TRINITY_DN21062_c0_g1~~TRINITY_DN21062_c0_g1_i1.p1  ORF type:complete len:634 (-),score=143.73 TRINITY_DN21062_c0_g1_i1:246-2147(-)
MDDSVNKTPEFSKSLSRELEDVINKQNLLTSRTRRRVLVSLQEQSHKEEDEEMGALRNRAIEEIINSEKSYLHQLEIVEEYFMKPLQESGILPSQVYANIFGDILGIRQVNKELLVAMEVSTDKIGKVFMDLAPYLKFYSTYANDFKQATQLVEDQMEKNKPFKALLAKQESRPEVQKKLNALLITPVQRIPRYKLLLDDIIKNTPRFHPDKDNLQEARTQIDAIAWYINDQIKDYENSRIMIDIQKSLQGGVPKIIKPDRKLIKQGNLMKVNKNGGHAQPRYVILFSDMLMYCKIKGNIIQGGMLELPKNDALEVCAVLPLKHTVVDEVVGKGVFTIKCQKEHLVLYSPNVEDSDWVDIIQKAIKTLKKNKASLRRESSMFEPMRKPDLIKIRRESLGKIMLMRKTEESKREMLKKGTNTRSPLSLFTPKKRTAKDGLSGSPFKLKRLAEEAASHPIVSPKEGMEPEKPKSPERMNKNAESPVLKSPKRSNYKTKITQENISPEVILRTKPKSEFKRNTRNSLRSLTLGKSSKLKNEKSKSIFRSPSIYDEPRKMEIPVEEDTMTSYLSGKICPLTPSTKPCNVDHLVKREPISPKDNEVSADDETDKMEIHPIAIHNGILNQQKKSYCTIS